MKKFWNLMLAALVIFGAVACTEKEVAPEQNAGMSIYATINAEQTRVDVVQDENYDTNKKWNTIWTAGDVLEVHSFDDNTFFYFENSADNVNKFTCNEPGVNDLIGDYVMVSVVTNTENCSTSYNSTKGKQGAEINVYIDNFDPANTINLETLTAFLRYSSNYEITLEATDDIFYDKDDNNVNTITLPASEEDVWVAVWPCENITFSYSIDGVKCKETKATFEAGKIYNLGELNDKVVLLNTEQHWSADNPWFAAHFWGNGEKDVPLTQVKDNLYGCVVPEGMTHVIFCRMNPEYTEFDWSRVFNQTCDFAVASAPNNYHYIISWGASNQKKCRSLWGPKSLASSEISATGIVGSMTDWNPANRYGMLPTNEKDVVVAYAIPVDASGEFKFVAQDTWGGDTGGNGTTKENTWNNTGDSNIKIGKTGVYDIYYNTSTKKYKYEASK